MANVKVILKSFASCLVYSLVVTLVDFVLILFFTQELIKIVYSLSFVMLIEGGVGLTIGGTLVLYSPLSGKVSEVIFRSKPWDAKRQKEAETQAKMWIATGGILLCLALLVSAL